MFKNAITSTPLFNDAANDYFDDLIVGNSWQRDVTFLSTLRALLAPHMKEGDTLNLSFTNSNYSKEQLASLGGRAVRAIVDNWIRNEHEIHVHNFNHYIQEENDAWITAVEQSFESGYSGWHRLEKVTLFFRKVFSVLCFVNPEQKSVVLFTGNIDMRRMHYLQCGIFAFLPWYFDPEKGVTAEEMELINSLREKTSDKYEACLRKIAEKYDFQTARIRRLLKGFETRYEQLQCDRVRNEINGIIRSLDSLDQQIAECLRRKRDAEANLLGLEMKIAEHSDEDSEIMEYFLCHKNLSLRNVDNSTMQFVVSSTLDYFDEEMAARVINNKRSLLYIDGYGDEVRNGQISASEMKRLMEEIFIEQNLRIRFCAAYRFQLEGTINAIGGFEYGPEFKDYLPNPHIDRFRCLGNYERIINARLKDRDYIGAVEQCTASCKSLNFGDGAVMREFVRKIYGHSGDPASRFIEDLDGNLMTVKEAVAWIRAKSQENAENA